MKNSFKATKKMSIAVSTLFVCLLIMVAFAILLGPGGASTAIAENSETTYDLSANRKTFVSDDNIGYTSNVETKLPFQAITNLSVKVSSNNGTSNVEIDNSTRIPVIKLSNSESFAFYLNTPDIDQNSEIKDGYKLSSDTWGSTQTGSTTQPLTAQGGTKVVTGGISTGALIVQTSYDGKNWTQSQLDKFSSGYYTTDYLKNFGGQNKNVFQPKGDDIKHGVYISLNFYYEVYRYEYVRTDTYYEWWQYVTLFGMIGGPRGKTDVYENVYSNIRETYTIFVIEDNPNTVTFNNLTTADTTEIVEVGKPKSEDKTQYEVEAEQYNNYLSSVIAQMMPTMLNNDMTTSGVRINVTANPYLKVAIKKDGKPYSLPKLQQKNGQKFYELLDSGKYDITVSSYSKSKTTTIYVDSVDSDIAFQRYFGKAVEYNGQEYGTEFLNYSPNNSDGNKRVFDANSEVPVFKGTLGLHLSKLNKNVLPLYGYITNTSIGKTQEVDSKDFTISDFGNYELVFATNSSYYNRVVQGNDNIKLSGDVRVYTFHFKLIGNSDASKINQELLNTKSVCDFSVASPSDYYPLYYAVSRTTADKGRVQVAFFDEDAAKKYAQKVAWAEIEQYADKNGQPYWLIPNINNLSGAKIKSTSGWANARAVKAYADSILARRFFDLTEVSSYLTLDITKDELEESGTDVTSLSCASIKKTVILWADIEQREKSILKNADIAAGADVVAYIGNQQYAILSAKNGIYSELKNGNCNLSLIHDYLGIDSYKVLAIGNHGKTLQIKYDVDLYSQLKAAEFSSGEVTLLEENIYGETTAYKICYIAEGDQLGHISIEKDKTGAGIIIKNIYGCIDPVSFIKIQMIDINNNTVLNYYTVEEAQQLHIPTQCVKAITISLIDRFGNSTAIVL